ncbi:outer membrane protein OmpA-like peptidoglycan-associated protein [Silvimonas terrae]|uniref:Outer membrane protein OmpA-like peptidoglycan-associated protein n=1 Tax=Silvimonas terrae TaxID=300266 RepID=A0A840RBU9_9NEIS|nr:OmpA family protein [Silvimonas terrae]MBB5190008.1 outer membrane protein OmpA-like peptidoglycan-associated protein [Silvimonas terrae]
MNLLESLNALIGSDEQSRLSQLFGMEPARARSTMSRIFATLLQCAGRRADQPQWRNQLQEVLQVFAAEGSLPAAMTGAALDDQQGHAPLASVTDRFLKLVFGEQYAVITNALDQVNGTSSHVGQQMLRYGGSLLAGLLVSKTQTDHLDIHKLLALITDHMPVWSAALTPSLNTLITPVPVPQRKRRGGWLGWLLMVLVFILLVLWLLRACDSRQESTQPASAPVAVASAAAVANPLAEAASGVTSALNSVTARLGEFFKLMLPDGTALNVPEHGIESKLVEFIKDSSKPVDKDTWFSFDRLTFETGAAKLMPESEEQLNNIALIMKAFPAVQLKLGGYTDNTGTAATNLKLSGERANSVMAELVKLGVAPARLSAEGYGDAHPVASNDTEEGRAQNRRIDIRVTAK